MCYCEPPKAFTKVWRKARKEHRCCECRQPIVKGQRYEYVSGIWEYPASFHTCEACSKLRNEITAIAFKADAWDCGPCIGELREYMHETGYGAPEPIAA